MEIIIRERRGRDTKEILEIEKQNGGWDKKTFRRETQGARRLSLVATYGNELISWILFEALKSEYLIHRITQSTWLQCGYAITDEFLLRLIDRLKYSRRDRIVMLVEEDRTNFLCHLRDDLGFRATTMHQNEYERGDVLLAGIEMEYRK